MNVNAIGALSAYTYQNTLAQTGSSSQAMSQALAVSQSQADDMSSVLSSLGSMDSQTALSGSSGIEALSALTYSATGKGPDALQALLGSSSPANNGSSLFSNSDAMPMSAAVMSPGTMAALVRYTYDQSQNHTSSAPQTTSQAVTSAQQALMASSLNLLA